ncbi:hybrid sensor histidine kinase/response regulator [Flavobacterium sp.]|uniref:sensor histidine kinase n=1 Tax=Flavobacterium sp. TaxID=239 RepID=UPI003F696F45
MFIINFLKINTLSILQDESSVVTFSVLSIILFAILVAFSILYFRKNKTNLETIKKLESQNNEINNQLILFHDFNKQKNNFYSKFLAKNKQTINTLASISKSIPTDFVNINDKNNFLYIQNELLELANINQKIAYYNTIDTEEFNNDEEYFLKDLIEKLKASTSEIATKNNTNFTITIDPKVPLIFVSDNNSLFQITSNLVANALQFAPNGNVNLTINQLSKTDRTVNLELIVEDDGIGITKENQHLIFNPYHTSIETNKNQGLGLYLIKKTIEKLKGSIIFESEPNKGSKFTVNIPLETNYEFCEENDFDYTFLKDKNMVLIEKNPVSQEITKRLIERHEANCDVLNNEDEALKLMETKNYDLVILAIELSDTLEDLPSKKIRISHPKIPIIAFTKYDFRKKEYYKENGITGFASKPIDTRQFYETLKNNLN